MRRFDKNSDGKIERGEMPDQFRPLFARLDADKNGVVSAEELTAYYQRTQPIAKPGKISPSPDPTPAPPTPTADDKNSAIKP